MKLIQAYLIGQEVSKLSGLKLRYGVWKQIRAFGDAVADEINRLTDYVKEQNPEADGKDLDKLLNEQAAAEDFDIAPYQVLDEADFESLELDGAQFSLLGMFMKEDSVGEAKKE